VNWLCCSYKVRAATVAERPWRRDVTQGLRTQSPAVFSQVVFMREKKNKVAA
jgi:hypothetical protein